MRPSGDYSKVTSTALARCSRLLYIAHGLPSSRTPDAERLASYLIIESFSCWSGLNRSAFLSCAMGARHPVHGRIRTPHGILNAQEALDRAVWFKDARKAGQSRRWSHRDEPGWGDQRAVSAAFAKLDPTNLGDLRSAWSVPTDVMNDLPTFRNYYAHKSQESAEKVSRLLPKYGVPSGKNPTQALLHRNPFHSTPMLLNWLYDLRNVIGFY